MKAIQRFFRWIYRLARHNNEFLLLIKFVESFASKVLSIFMIGIIFFALYDIAFFLIEEWFLHSPESTTTTDVIKTRFFDAFGLFLNVLIALELLDNITAYLKNHVIQLELVIVTAIIALARKIIIFDFSDESSISKLMTIAVATVLLSISYVLISKRTRKE